MSKDLLPLQKLAKHYGIEASYIDASGKLQSANTDAVIDILKSFGVDASNPAQVADAIRATEAESQLGPVTIAWDGRPSTVRVVSSAKKLSLRHTTCHLRLEDGSQENWSVRLSQTRGRISLPKLPAGYHTLEIETPDERLKSLIISAPAKSYTNPELSRSWGAFLPMHAAHSSESWGAGNFGDWQKLTNWVAANGGRFVGSLPILAAFIDEWKNEPSPYSPASRLFWNEFFIDIPQVPEFQACVAAQKLAASAPFQRSLRQFRNARLVDYHKEMKLRREVLTLMADFHFTHSSQRRRAFDTFLRKRSLVADYARFRAACEKEGRSWHTWPQRMQNGNVQPRDYLEKVARYHMYVQWIAQEQINAVLANGAEKNVALYLDLPLGVNPDGYDVWRERDSFVLDMNVGAPPDAFFTKGQDWGFSPLHPQKLRQQGYRYFREIMDFQMRHAGMLRFDHVMALHRLYWIPKGRPASEGVYVRYRADELFALLSLESHRHKTVLVGENLGTVPPEINSGMKRHRVRQMYVVQYELRPDAKNAMTPPTEPVVASMNTHDMPPFAAFWEGKDIADRVKLGLIKKSDVQRERAARAKLRAALTTFLKKQRLVKGTQLSATEALHGALRYLSASDAEMVLITLEDLWGEDQPQNIPGTGPEKPNWRQKARFTIEQLAGLKDVEQLLSEVRALRVTRKKRVSDSRKNRSVRHPMSRGKRAT